MASPLRERDFGILFAGRVVDALGDAVTPAALALAVVTATRSSAGLAIILICGMLPRVALLPFAGVVVDRAGARLTALASDVVAGLAQLAIGLPLLSGYVDIPAIAVAAAVGGAASAFGVPATLPLVSGTVDPAGRRAANSLLGAASSAASVAGPVIAGALIFTVGAGWAFVLDAITFAVSAGTLAVIHVRGVPVLGGPLRRQLAAGWAEVRDRTWYWASIIGHGTCNFALGLLMTTGPLIAVTELGGKTVWLAALEASAAGYLAGAIIAGRARISRPILAVDLVLTSLAVPLVLFGLAAPAWAVVAAYGLAAVGLGFANPIWLTAVQQEVPAEVLARVSAYDWLVSLGGQLVGYAVGPTLTQVAGFRWPLSAAAALVVITLLVPASLPSVRGVRLAQLRREDDMARKIALLGGGFSDDPDTLIDEFVLAEAPRPRPRICFIPTASGDSRGYIERFYTAFKDRDCEPTDLQLFRREHRDLRPGVLAQDILYVGGGNTANLLAIWRLHGLDQVIREAYEAGVVLCGISAGAACWLESCLTDSFGSLAPLRDGLGFLQGSMCPHYDSEGGRRPAYRTAIADGTLPAGWAVDDGAAALFTDEQLTEVVARVPGATVHHVTRSGGVAGEQSLPARLLTAEGKG